MASRSIAFPLICNSDTNHFSCQFFEVVCHVCYLEKNIRQFDTGGKDMKDYEELAKTGDMWIYKSKAKWVFNKEWWSSKLTIFTITSWVLSKTP